MELREACVAHLAQRVRRRALEVVPQPQCVPNLVGDRLYHRLLKECLRHCSPLRRDTAASGGAAAASIGSTAHERSQGQLGVVVRVPATSARAGAMLSAEMATPTALRGLAFLGLLAQERCDLLLGSAQLGSDADAATATAAAAATATTAAAATATALLLLLLRMTSSLRRPGSRRDGPMNPALDADDGVARVACAGCAGGTAPATRCLFGILLGPVLHPLLRKHDVGVEDLAGTWVKSVWAHRIG